VAPVKIAMKSLGRDPERPWQLGSALGLVGHKVEIMAIFRDDPEDWQRLDWQLLQNSSVALYHSLSILDQDLAWLRAHAYWVDDISCAHATNEAAFHALIAQELNFPDYYGRNLDALGDCVSNLEISLDGGRVLLLRSFDTFARHQPAMAQGVLGTLATNARRFLLTGRRLLVLAQSDNPRIRFDTVGACPVMWNPREWQDAARL
jgi:hypothetical protein